ncbi:MAG: PA2778 family cysteine peptidase [Pseudomonadota bacterium]
MVPQTVALRSAWPEGVARTVELTQVPFFPQDEFQCGPAALATVLNYTGVQVTPDELAKNVYLPSRQGSLQVEMLAAPRRHGRISYQLRPQYEDVLREVAAGNPVIVLQDVNPVFTQWHYAVLNGFDYPSGTLYLRSGEKRRLEMPFTAFEREWMAGNRWAMVAVAPDRIPATAAEDAWMNAVLAMTRVSGAEAAKTAYATALARWPNNLAAAIGLANQYHQAGSYGRAIDVLRVAQQRHPESVIVLNNLAQALTDEGRHAEALSQIDQALAIPSPFASDVRATRQLILERIATKQKAGSRQ